MSRGITEQVRQIVIERDNFQCQWCGGRISHPYSLQHRRARMMGGSSLPWINEPANLVLVHGTGTTGCHGTIESNPIEAEKRGFRLGPNDSPYTTPVTDWSGADWYNTDQGFKNYGPPREEATA